MIGSSVKASVGRILHVYSNLWSGPRPGMVVGGPFEEPRDFVGGPPHVLLQVVNLNVFLDGHNEPATLRFCRERQAGNTFASVAVLEASPGERDQLLKTAIVDAGSDVTMWAEWPPRS